MTSRTKLARRSSRLSRSERTAGHAARALSFWFCHLRGSSNASSTRGQPYAGLPGSKPLSHISGDEHCGLSPDPCISCATHFLKLEVVRA